MFTRDKKEFGRIKDEIVTLHTLKNDRICAEILDYGATLRSLTVDGVDVISGYDTIDAYIKNSGYLGAVVGRYANRIRGGKFTLNGIEYTLNNNERGITHLHGGIKGFDKYIFHSSFFGNSLHLTIESEDGDEGYPGRLDVEVIYTLFDNELSITYKAICDDDTVLNMTNHAYFNLDGYGSGTILNQSLKINSDAISAVDDDLIPVETIKVKGTPFDFNTPKAIGRDIDADNEQLKKGSGYDHNFYISNNAPKEDGTGLNEAAVLYGKKLSMTVYTDMPCIQIYTGNFMSDCMVMKSGIPARKNGAVCLETQFAPDSPNHGEAILKKGELFKSTTSFKFDRI